MTETATGCHPIAPGLQRFASGFDERFSSFLESARGCPPSLAAAVRYSALAPGKRLRPFLVTECCRAAGGDPESALPAAMAIECVHVFSLIHDDLPAMDDSPLRRGRPTSHVEFGEATAILAGDALLALAFEILVGSPASAETSLALIRELAIATGWEGMIGGQVLDMEGESRPADLGIVQAVHEQKTVRLIQAACRMGGLAAGAAAETLSALGEYGGQLGRAFQIADDLLDVISTPETLGKPAGHDAAAGKQSYPASVGVEESRAAARQAAEAAVAALDGWGDEAEALRELADFVVERVR